MIDTTNTDSAVELDMGGLTSALASFNPANPAAPAPDPTPAPTPDPAPAPEPKKEDRPADEKPKKGLDALPGEEVEEKKEEPKKEEPAAEPEVDTSKWQKPQRDAFAAMRSEKKRAMEQAKDAESRFQKLQKEFETFKTSAPKLEEFEALKRERDARNVTSSQAWEDEVAAPIRAHHESLKSTAETAGIDGEELLDAADQKTPFARAQAVRALFKKLDSVSEEPIPLDLVSDVILAVEAEARDLHALYAKGTKMEADAEQTLLSINHQTEQQKAAAAKAEEAAYLKHHDHIYEQMAKKLPSIFSNPEVAEEIKSARPATDPADKAFQAQAAAALPTIVSELFKLRQEVKKERDAKLALLNTRPGVKGPSATPTKPADSDGVELDEDGLAAALRGMKG